MSEFVGYLTFSSISRKNTIIFILKENKLFIDTLKKTFLIWKKKINKKFRRCNKNSPLFWNKAKISISIYEFIS